MPSNINISNFININKLYLNTPDLNHTILLPTIKSKGILFAHLNICSILPKCLSLYNLISSMDIDIISLNETWLNNCITNASLTLPGYRIHRLDRLSRGGGVMFLVHNHWNTNIENTLLTSNIELLHIVLELPNTKPINIVSVYRPPNSIFSAFLHDFTQFLNNIPYNHLPLVLLGDFNINMLNNNSMCNQFTTILKDYGLSNVGTSATRITFDSVTQIDLVICNTLALTFIHSYNSILTGISDHNLLTFGYKKTRSVKPSSHIKTFKILKNNALPNIKLSVIDIQISDSLNTTNVINAYMTSVNQITDSKTTTMSKKISITQHPWITYDFIKQCQLRDKLFNIGHKIKCPTTLAKAKKMRNKCTMTSRSLKRQYIEMNLNRHRSNPKKIWQILRPFYADPKNVSNIVKLQSESRIITDPVDIVNYFNSHFINSINELYNKFMPIALSIQAPITLKPPVEFSFTDISPNFIIPIINSIKTHGRSRQSINSKILAFCSNEFGNHFAALTNTIFKLADFPDQWKQAEVVPIHKGGCKLNASNYRPISILPNVSKIIERVMHNQISNFINTYNILPQCQHGFRANHSTTTCTIAFFDFVNSNVASGKHVIAVFLDFSKAFDLLSHEILLDKLIWLGFSQNAISLIKSYLHGRYQRVYSIGVYSRLVEIILGVPQGSILGPLLFSIYIFDMPYCIKHSILFFNLLMIVLS